MIQLSFEPALDPYHTMFRLMRLRDAIGLAESLHRDHVRIIDFYFVFPFKVNDITLKKEHQKFRALAKKYIDQKPYGEFPLGNDVFERMNLIQEAAFQTLAVDGYLDADKMRNNLVSYRKKDFQSGLLKRIEVLNETQRDLLALMKVLATEYDLTGIDGLKKRTGLMEHRYDAI